jgi:EmrB/QacA subfamily drug resistance transporter
VTPTGLRRYLVLVVVMTGTSMVMLDLAVVNVALPTIMVSLGTNVVEARWIVTAFMLVSSLVMPLTGWLGRRFGYASLWIASLALFSLGSGLCAASTNLNMLVGARIVQALGAGFIQSTDMAIITTTFPPEQRGRAIGIWGIALSLGPMIGPTTAGYLVEHFNWQSVFMLNLPLGAIAILSSVAVLDRSKDEPPPPLDWYGYLAMATLMTTSLLTLDHGNQVGWHHEIIKLGIICSVTAFAATILVEWNHSSALVPLRLFKNTDFSIAVLISLIRSTGMFASFFLQPLFLQQIQGHDPIHTGLLLVPASISFTVAMPLAGVLADRFGGRWPTVIGAIIAGIAYMLYWDLDYRTSNLNVIIPQMLRGIGMSLIVTPSMTVGLSAVARKDIGTASWLINIAQRFGGAITVAMLANFHYNGTFTELGRLGGAGNFLDPPGGRLANMAKDLGHSNAQLSDVTRSLYQWDAGQAAATVSFENLFTAVGIALLFIAIPAFFMSKRRRPDQRPASS